MTNAKAHFNKSLRPRKPEGSLGRTAQDVHLDSHTAPELWHVSVITNVIFIAYSCYCLVVLSISLITAFILIIGDVFMWLSFGEIDLGKLPFLEHKIYKYWLTCVKLGLFDGAMVLVQLSVIISCCWTRTAILSYLFFVHYERYERRMSECAWQFLSLVTQSKSPDNTSNNAIYKT